MPAKAGIQLLKAVIPAEAGQKSPGAIFEPAEGWPRRGGIQGCIP
jgi:hypothetical protein